MLANSINIFYTDDDLDDQDLFKDAAREVSDSLNVITQSSGNELIRLLHNPPPFPSVLFLDLNMPNKNGYDVLLEIRQTAATRHIPVIIFSTTQDEKAVSTTRQLGANLYIPKPTSYSSLKKVISYSISIDWNTFSATDKDFVYRAN